MNKEERFRYLFNRYMQDIADSDERSELAEIAESMDDSYLTGLLQESWNNLMPDISVFSQEESDIILSKITGINERIISVSGRSGIILSRIAATALIVIALGVSVYYLFMNERTGQVVATDQEISQPNDILPGGNKAILTLADGSHILLDSVSAGFIIQQSGTQILKDPVGQIVYIPDRQKGDSKALFNTISTPAGGQYKLILSDGTRVWLNASSSIRYPVEFSGNERKVHITGEVYFEVMPAMQEISSGVKRVPFIVDINSGAGMVEVVGTSFNINSYPDEFNMKTTLVEGSVNFKLPAATDYESRVIRLQPGQQAQLSDDGKIVVIDNVETERVVAWTQGYFHFSSSSLEEVMKEIARWYDVEVIFEGESADRRFGGKIQRDLNLSEVMNILRKNNLSFRIEGRKLYVKS